MVGGDITVEILRGIRDELRNVRSEVHALRTESDDWFGGLHNEFHALRTETAERFNTAETALLDLAKQLRFALESRVDKLESK